MSQAVLAKRLQVSSAAVAKLERAETTGGITLGKLDDVARALDCSIFYAFVPHSTLESTVERQARRIALSRLGYVATTMALEEQDIPAEERADYLERYIRDLIARNDIWHESASEKVPSAG
jgi:predicted DNA-binding mobile mystery protein A